MRGISLLLTSVALMACNEQGFNGESEDFPPGSVKPQEVENVTDTYTQSKPTQADILFIVSNWWSMEQATAELADSFDSLLDVFLGSGVDYHIGVASTDTDHSTDMGKLREANGVRFIDASNPDPLGTFVEMASMIATGCAGPRRPRDATYLALEMEADDWNAGFRREDASMHTVFVSDERDLSTMISFDEWVGWYNTFTDTPEIDTLSTIVDFSKDGLNLQATELIGGSSHPIQEMPWANVLEEIGMKAKGLRREYFLSKQPVEGTILVSVIAGSVELSFDEGTIETGGDWTYDAVRNSIQFNEYEPPTDSDIVINYDAL
jgi:hypothetical protein